jgi:hypothetical protein
MVPTICESVHDAVPAGESEPQLLVASANVRTGTSTRARVKATHDRLPKHPSWEEATIEQEARRSKQHLGIAMGPSASRAGRISTSSSSVSTAPSSVKPYPIERDVSPERAVAAPHGKRTRRAKSMTFRALGPPLDAGDD